MSTSKPGAAPAETSTVQRSLFQLTALIADRLEDGRCRVG